MVIPDKKQRLEFEINLPGFDCATPTDEATFTHLVWLSLPKKDTLFDHSLLVFNMLTA